MNFKDITSLSEENQAPKGTHSGVSFAGSSSSADRMQTNLGAGKPFTGRKMKGLCQGQWFPWWRHARFDLSLYCLSVEVFEPNTSPL